jgi:heme/copper-type cytochrome/quinol oxidase subunit 4
MKLPARLVLMITIVVAVTDLVEYYHLKQNPEQLTLSFTIQVIFVTIVPIWVILWVWHKRNML